MFRKIVSNLTFSPALVGQLSFYARRLKKEETTRRLGLIFTALALVVQSLAVFSPPEAANAASASDFVRGGISSREEYLRHYDANTNNIRDLFNYLGITRANLAHTSVGTINSKGSYSWGMTSRFSPAQGERTYNISTGGGNTRAFYERPLWIWDSGSNVQRGSNYKALVGTSSKGEWFAIMFNCGNLILKNYPPQPVCPPNTVGTYPRCAPRCPIKGKENLAANDPGCRENPVAVCSSLTITKLTDSYQFDGFASAAHGATVGSYTYTVKRDGTTVAEKTNRSSKLTDTYTYKQSSVGSYNVELTVKTSLGDRTSANCVKTFHITPPPVCPLNPSLEKDDPECQPCPGDETLWIKDEKCAPVTIRTKQAVNRTQRSVDAIATTAKPSDVVVYTITLENTGNKAESLSPVEILDDVTEYAQVKDFGGGTYDAAKKTLTWPKTTIEPGEKLSYSFAVQVLSSIPLVNRGVSDPSSYDCTMTNSFGNTLNVKVQCPPQKETVEQVVSELPETGPGENMIFAGVLFSVVSYFYARSRQLGKEVRVIRKNVTTGNF